MVGFWICFEDTAMDLFVQIVYSVYKKEKYVNDDLIIDLND
jgi:hypothetical protein